MKTETDEFGSEERLKNLPVQAENPAFASDEMIECDRCARSNPPTRSHCLYCGAELEIPGAQSKFLKINMRPLEAWEKGFNLIFSPASEDFDDAQIERAASLLKLETQSLRRILESKKSLPLARVETQNDAEIVQKKLLETASLDAKIISDEDLNANNPPRRLRGMEFSDEKLILILFNADEIVRIVWDDLILIVTGAIFERRVKGVEARRKSGKRKLVETNETASDKFLIDLYSRADQIGFRVEQQGFDFSCLGAEKSLLAAENLAALVKRLSKLAPDAKIVEDYMQVRAPLAAVWAVEERMDALGLKRDRFAKFNRENVTTINNSAQFTKYSRLQRRLL